MEVFVCVLNRINFTRREVIDRLVEKVRSDRSSHGKQLGRICSEMFFLNTLCEDPFERTDFDCKVLDVFRRMRSYEQLVAGLLHLKETISEGE